MLLCCHFMNSWINIVCLNFSWAGIGVPLDSQHRLFQPFSHASSSTSQEQEGTGIGLVYLSGTNFSHHVFQHLYRRLLAVHIFCTVELLVKTSWNCVYMFCILCWFHPFQMTVENCYSQVPSLSYSVAWFIFCWVLKSAHRFYYVANTCIFSHIFSMI
jgi:hypothetical protein